MDLSKGQYWDVSWNVVTGCSPVSAGCVHCWARRMAQRLKGRYGYPADDPFQVTFRRDRLQKVWGWKSPKVVYVTLMGDLFHDDVSWHDIQLVWQYMMTMPDLRFLVLTKRAERMYRVVSDICSISNVPTNDVWLGVSVEDQHSADERVPWLLNTPAAGRFVSVEPMLEPVDLTRFRPLWGLSEDQSYLDWVICGGETGPRSRPMQRAWVESIRDQCVASDVPFFLKGAGTYWASKKSEHYRMLNDHEWNQVPDFWCGKNAAGVARLRKVGMEVVDGA